ncbi:hypothetical protein EML15_02730 [Corynebacterium sp. sy017]|uniref:hypothetical protein n=1 Tax=unclassified Corynebacterium TaxID=2624378 RepID=UPI00118479A7|nr:MULTISPECIES: hypothetical protein [unclassified Corynebacterium]MBP3088070.1 hypothetical protein [Corynebacterium sp. sy017]QDZ43022.1 hypothetical protein FQV43_07490 [Corynebacterium sp. sy039]TSD92596.1 hypothetical protein ELY17_02730 [Corynebacterium sp. SY003]
MKVHDATLRHRELVQEIFNIGDEVATYIENLAEAIADWDEELVEDCITEFEEIIAEASQDSRTILAELYGLNQALTSGLAAGTVALGEESSIALLPTPVLINTHSLRERFPITQSPIIVGELTQALDSRTELVKEYLAHVTQWELGQTEYAARNPGLSNLPRLYNRTRNMVLSVGHAWLAAVAQEHPHYARTMRGSNPPQFLNERARIDAIVARVRSKKNSVASADAS